MVPHSFYDENYVCFLFLVVNMWLDVLHILSNYFQWHQDCFFINAL